jgi:hypothetical protein
METPDNARRRRFVAWFNDRYRKVDASARRKQFMQDSAQTGEPPLSKGRVAQLFRNDLAFGEEAAINLARRFQLRDDYFLTDGGQLGTTAPPAEPQQVQNEMHRRLLAAFETLVASERAKTLMEIERRAAEVRELGRTILREKYGITEPPEREQLVNTPPEPVKRRGRKKGESE